MARGTQGGLLFTFRLVPIICAELARAGVESAPLIARAGLPAESAGQDVTAPLHRIERFVDLAAARLGRDLFGLELATQVPVGAYGLSTFVARTAPTLEVGLGRLTEIAGLINPIGRFQLVREPTGARLHYAVVGRRTTLGAHLNEYTLFYIVRQLADMVGRPVPVTRTWFSHWRRTGERAVAEQFGCRGEFGAADCGFALDDAVLAYPPQTADPALHAFLLAQAQLQLERQGSSDVVAQLIRVIEMRLGRGEVGIRAVAAALASTARSVQRQLAAAGTTYRDVLHHVRSRRHGELERSGLAPSEVARQLGYRDVKAMHRAL